MSSTKVRLAALPIWTPAGAQILRVIRNSGRYGFSHNHEEISFGQQVEWWESVKDHCHAWLYATGSATVGFGLILRRDNGEWSPSAGVLPEHAGRGYGGYIVDDLVDQARARGIQLHAAALLSNPAAVRTHRPERWESLSQDETYAYFRSLP